MRFSRILALLPFVVCALIGPVLADGSDVLDNYVAGTHAGGNIETDTSGDKGSGNTFVGQTAGRADTTGVANTGLGYGALRGVTTGRGNIGIGYMAGQDLTTDTHKLHIGTSFYPTYGIWGTLSSGFIGINNSSPAVALDVTGAITASGIITGASSKADSLLISAERTPAGSDSSMALRTVSGNPYIRFNATDGDVTNITVNTSDQILFQGATGGYVFDAPVSVGKYVGLTAISAMSDTTGWSGIRMFTFTGDTLYVYKASHAVVSIQ